MRLATRSLQREHAFVCFTLPIRSTEPIIIMIVIPGGIDWRGRAQSFAGFPSKKAVFCTSQPPPRKNTRFMWCPRRTRRELPECVTSTPATRASCTFLSPHHRAQTKVASDVDNRAILVPSDINSAGDRAHLIEEVRYAVDVVRVVGLDETVPLQQEVVGPCAVADENLLSDLPGFLRKWRGGRRVRTDPGTR